MRPHRRQPTRLPRPWDSPGKNTGVDCHFLLQCMKLKSESEVAQLCPTLSDPMDCSLTGSSVHGIFQARVLEWSAIAFSDNSYTTHKWETDGETVEMVSDFIFLGSKITADGDCSHEIKRCLLLKRKIMTNLDSILKSRDNTFPTKVHLVKAMVFLIVMYVCESWAIKKAESQRIDAFELWCWRRPERCPLDCREIQPEEISPEYSLEGLMLNFTWCEELTHLKRPWCWQRLKAGGEGDDRGWDGWMASPTQRTWVCVNSGSWWWTGRPGVLQSMGSQRFRHDWAVLQGIWAIPSQSVNPGEPWPWWVVLVVCILVTDDKNKLYLVSSLCSRKT